MRPGSAAGRVDVKDSDQLKGETHTAARIVEDAGIDEPAIDGAPAGPVPAAGGHHWPLPTR
ncbi:MULTISPECIES: hypothetical protein [unclassified Streptomyces]|uniref:hypothetical protein n=1 Tax=unclassified Streptomyces TaxID=2593676 RepID=UPI000BE36F02|nr:MULTISPECIES: hypothetical protein [unclassified Streptomyces]